jgi:hypothetical protein
MAINEPGAPFLETPLCDEHRAVVAKGAAWDYQLESGHGILRIGSDADPRLREWTTEEFGTNSEVGPGLTLELDLMRDGETVHRTRLWITREQSARLGELLTRLGKPLS